MFAYGCSESEKLKSYKYDTQVKYEELEKLKGKKLVLITYNHNSNALHGIDNLDHNLSEIVTKKLESQLEQQYAPLFILTSLPSNNKKNRLNIIDPHNAKVISELIKGASAEGGVITTNAYGYKMKGASGILWAGIESVVPEEHKKSYRAVLSHSEVARYYFASVTYIFNAEGEMLWNFSGVASVYPSPDFDLAEIGRSLVGADPSGQKVANEMIKAGNYYNDFSNWLLIKDLDKSNKKNYFSDYPEELKDNKIALYPSQEGLEQLKVSW